MAETAKVRIKYNEGSQTLSNCNPLAGDKALHEVAMAIVSLRNDEALEVVKIEESILTGV